MLRDLVHFSADVNRDGICQDNCDGSSKAKPHRRYKRHLPYVNQYSHRDLPRLALMARLGHAGRSRSGIRTSHLQVVIDTSLIYLEGKWIPGACPIRPTTTVKRMRDGEALTHDRLHYLDSRGSGVHASIRTPSRLQEPERRPGARPCTACHQTCRDRALDEASTPPNKDMIEERRAR